MEFRYFGIYLLEFWYIFNGVSLFCIYLLESRYFDIYLLDYLYFDWSQVIFYY